MLTFANVQEALKGLSQVFQVGKKRARGRSVKRGCYPHVSQGVKGMKRRNIQTRRRPAARSKDFSARKTDRQVVNRPEVITASPRTAVQAQPEVPEPIKRRAREIGPNDCLICGGDLDSRNHFMTGFSGDRNNCRVTWECVRNGGSGRFSRDLEGREAAAAHRAYFETARLAGWP